MIWSEFNQKYHKFNCTACVLDASQTREPAMVIQNRLRTEIYGTKGRVRKRLNRRLNRSVPCS